MLKFHVMNVRTPNSFVSEISDRFSSNEEAEETFESLTKEEEEDQEPSFAVVQDARLGRAFAVGNLRSLVDEPSKATEEVFRKLKGLPEILSASLAFPGRK